MLLKCFFTVSSPNEHVEQPVLRSPSGTQSTAWMHMGSTSWEQPQPWGHADFCCVCTVCSRPPRETAGLSKKEKQTNKKTHTTKTKNQNLWLSFIHHLTAFHLLTELTTVFYDAKRPPTPTLQSFVSFIKMNLTMFELNKCQYGFVSNHSDTDHHRFSKTGQNPAIAVC